MAGRDRISELPAGILDKILVLLPIQESARMAVLSTFWRDIWFSLTHLNFNDDFFGYMHEKHISAKTTNKRKKTSDIWISAGLYVINKVLMHHNGRICKFVFHCPFKKANAVSSRSYDFDQWLLFVTQKGVEEIHLRFKSYEYSLPNCIFSCLTLKRLHLCNVIVEQINAPCILPNVTSLCLEDVNFDSRDLPNCAADLPMLENLSFTGCVNMFNFNITAPKLGSLTITDCDSGQLGSFLPVNLDLTSVRTLVLDAYDIKEFVDGCTGRGPQLQPPALNVEYLKLLSNEQSYQIEMHSEVIYLLQMCPKLCVLDIDLQFIGVVLYFEEDMPTFSEELHVGVQKNKMLHTLKLTEFQASEFDLLFIKGLLAGLPALEKVVITPYGILEFDEKFENIRKLLCLPRASTKAEIIFSPPLHLSLTREGARMRCFVV